MQIARVIGIIGRVLVVSGLVLLFYTAYLLWGTNVYTANVQKDLAHQVAAAPIVTQQTVSTSPAGEIPPARPAQKPALGDPLFTMLIPKIGVRTVIVEGGTNEDQWRDSLKRGPGHFPEAPYPGEDGNVAVSGHRTTYGAPFYRLDELAEGDAIVVESGPARYRYTVTEKRIVSPNATEVVQNRGFNEITLTTCHPRFSAAQRLVVHARYDGADLIPPPAPARQQPAGGEEPATQPEGVLVPAPAPEIPRDALALGILSIASLLGAMALSNRMRPVAAWTTVVLLVAVGLWTAVFPQVTLLMPANY